MTPAEFESINHEKMTASFRDYKKHDKAAHLHRYMFERGAEIGRGGFGEVRTVSDQLPNTAVKKVRAETASKKMNSLREVKMLRAACEQNEKDFARSSECKSTAVVHFYGCVEESKEVFQFQELMTRSLSSQEAKSEFFDLPAAKKIEVMLDIIDKFIELHRLNIVHSDIKPGNIMAKGISFSDLRIIDLGLANFKGQKYWGGTDGYLPPERYGPQRYNSGLAFTDDVFALGITFAVMNKGFEKAHFDLKAKCFEHPKNRDHCNDVIIEGLERTFTKEKGLDSILGVIKQSVELAVESRLRSMEDFSIGLIKEFAKLEGSQATISRIMSSSETFDENNSSPSFWKHHVLSEEIFSKNEPGGILESPSGTFGSASPRNKRDSEDKHEERVNGLLASSKLKTLSKASSHFYAKRIIL